MLDGLAIERPNRVLAADITYIAMARGMRCRVGIIDVYSRQLLALRLGNSMDTHFCLEALSEALECVGPPEFMTTDQGTQFTSQAFTSVLQANNVENSMDGQGSWRVNVFIERTCWSLKYEHVYVHAYDELSTAHEGIGTYIEFCNRERQHSSIGRLTPVSAYERDGRTASSAPPPAGLASGPASLRSW